MPFYILGLCFGENALQIVLLFLANKKIPRNKCKGLFVISKSGGEI